MRVLLDECVPRRFGQLLAGHDVTTAPMAGWAGVNNGELLRRAAEAFDVLVTVDRNLAFQQRADSTPLPVAVLHAASNRLAALEPLAPALRALLDRPLTRTVHHLSQPS